MTSKSNLSCEAGCGPTVSCSEWSRLMFGSSEMTLQLLSRNLLEILGIQFCLFGDVGGPTGSTMRVSFVVGGMAAVAPRVVNDLAFLPRKICLLASVVVSDVQWQIQMADWDSKRITLAMQLPVSIRHVLAAAACCLICKFSIKERTSLPLTVPLAHHQVLRLPHTHTASFTLRRRPGTSPNIAPATDNGRHWWPSSYMQRHLQCAGLIKRYLQCTEQQRFRSNILIIDPDYYW